MPSSRALIRILAAWSTDPSIAAGDGVVPRFASVAVQQVVELILASGKRRIHAERLRDAFADTDVLDATAASDLIEHLKNQGVLVFHSISNAYEFAAATDLPNGHDRWGNFPADRASWVLATKGQAMSAVEFAGPPSSGFRSIWSHLFRRPERGNGLNGS